MGMSTFVKQSHVVKVTLGIVVLFTICACFLGPENFNGLDDEHHVGTMILNRLYFVMTTLSTVGYGDISPKSHHAKIMGIVLMGLMLSVAIL